MTLVRPAPPLARPATPADAGELVRLRTVMLDSHLGPVTDLSWQPAAVDTLRTRLADPSGDLAAFVVDRPGTPGALASTAVGVVEYRLGSPANPTGVSGYVFSVATDPDLRRRGYSRACVEALLDWFRARGVRKIDLRASRDGEPLYASLGFVRTPDPAMRLTL
ncbi:GNAT family N-acetyltransferase [Streptomyces liangshanensis]|uniref:GNAT family N-acetyltransferase n=1 Tax=Streptomyces liangshanensis TaxID=2717324 RepID=A0A6G9H371_9ACTN|nr:GNAT family N-acetyltransferase [Streptomyces liangshanensis]QIQ04982.1 GNAT family N-acetyltransferase [Streptomyces liangshanensis]